MSLDDRIAKRLAWSLEDVRSLSLHSLRDLVRPTSPKLAAVISDVIARGELVTRER